MKPIILELCICVALSVGTAYGATAQLYIDDGAAGDKCLVNDIPTNGTVHTISGSCPGSGTSDGNGSLGYSIPAGSLTSTTVTINGATKPGSISPTIRLATGILNFSATTLTFTVRFTDAGFTTSPATSALSVGGLGTAAATFTGFLDPTNMECTAGPCGGTVIGMITGSGQTSIAGPKIFTSNPYSLTEQVVTTIPGNGSTLLQTTNDLTLTGLPPAPAITHTGNFYLGQVNAQSLIFVSTGVPATDTVNVGINPDPHFTVTAINAVDWTCNVGTLVCSHPPLAAGTSEAIQLIGTVSVSASPTIINGVTLSGGGLISPVTATDTVAVKNASRIVQWGDTSNGQGTPPPGNGFVAISGGELHSLALESDGTIVQWGATSIQGTPPSGTGFIAIAAGAFHSLALKGDGSIAQWGDTSNGQGTPPSGTGFIAIAAGAFHSLALKNDGTVVQWGDISLGEGTAPTGNGFVAIAAGAYHSIALRHDGTILQWGDTSHNQGAGMPVTGGFTAIRGGLYHSLALKMDGRIVQWGDSSAGQAAGLPSINGFTAIAAGLFHNLALQSNGTIVQWGAISLNQAMGLPAGTGFVAIAAGGYHSLSLHPDPAIWTITSTADSGPGSLRDTISNAMSGDTINFNFNFSSPVVIALNSTLNLNTNLTINGPGSVFGLGAAGLLSIKGNNSGTVLTVAPGITATVSGLTISGGSGITGGGIVNQGTLTVTQSVISNNATSGVGGGIFNQGGTLTVSQSVMSPNLAQASGGGIANSGTLTVSAVTLSGNRAIGDGGAIFNSNPSSVTLTNSTLFANFAGGNGGGLAGSFRVSFSTLAGNSGQGFGGTCVIPNCGGALSAPANPGTPGIILKNTVLSNSFNCRAQQPFNFIFSGGSNLSTDNTCSSFLTAFGDTNNTSAGVDPGGLQNNGGAILIPTVALLPTSPAVDAIPLANCTAIDGTVITTDERGTPRPQGNGCDIGAFELAVAGGGSGGGFAVPFSAITAKLSILAGPPPSFDLNANFTLGGLSDGINPVTEAVSFQVGTYYVSIPAGSFKQITNGSKQGGYTFGGTINGVALSVQIVSTGGSSYQLKASGAPVNLIALKNPIDVRIAVGNDAGMSPGHG